MTTILRLNLGGRKWFRVVMFAGAAAGIMSLSCRPGFVQETSAPREGAESTSSLRQIAPAGEWLARCLDKMDVEHHWLRSQEHVAWRSGLPIASKNGKKLTPLAHDETHCSAFAAAAAEQLGMYLLHPPEHSHVLLANAQFKWLSTPAAREAGWRPVDSPEAAQARANVGEFVVAVFENRDHAKAGHIAVVRPSVQSPQRIAAKGPEITQAGFANYRSTDLATGFAHHPGAWEPAGRGAVRFFAHPVEAKRLAGE